MKLSSIIGILIVIVAIVAGILVLSGNGEDAQTNEEANLVDETETPEGQFIQIAPDDASLPGGNPPGAGADTETTSEASQTQTPEAVAGVSHTISMTDTGFEPADVTIAVGDTVTFVNNGQAAKWPASDVHPTHRSYPGSDINKCGTAEAENIFDSCRGLSTGESYSFTFTEAGSWEYHDHRQASHGGTITVTP